MKILVLTLILALTSTWPALAVEQAFNFPVTIAAGTTTSNSFAIPPNTEGTFQIQIPCDPAWSVKVSLQQSFDKGATWDCDGVKIPCWGFTRDAVPCLDIRTGQPKPFLTVFYEQRGANGQRKPLDTKAVMRLLITSNIAKSFTVTTTFDKAAK